MGMRYFLLMIAVVMGQSVLAADKDHLTNEESAKVIEVAIREAVRKPEGRLTEEEYKKERKLRQEAEGELSIVKTITINSSPEMRDAKAKTKELQDSLDRVNKENC